MSFWILVAMSLATPAEPASWAIEHVTVEVGDGTRNEDCTVVVIRGRIRALGTDVRIPDGLPRIDGHGKVLCPGFIEVRSYIGLTEVGQVEGTNDHQLQGVAVAPAFRASDGFNPLSLRIPVERAQGVTSAVAAPSGTLLYGTGALFDLTGSADARLRPVAMYGGVGEAAAAGLGKSRGGVWLKLREILADVRFYTKNKPAIEGGRSRKLSLDPIHFEALVPVVQGKLPLVLDAFRLSDIRAAVRFSREHGIRLVVAGGTEAWLMAEELAAAKVPLVLTPSYLMPFSFETLHARDDAATVIRAAGVELVLSAGTWAGRLRQEAGIAVANGLDRGSAIRAITLAPAEVLGEGDSLGSVSPGKRANLVLWSGDPLETSSVAETVWIDGVEQTLDNRQRQLVNRYLERSPEP